MQKSKTPNKTHGGARPGAGRKVIEPTRIVNLRLPLADLDAIQALGLGINQFYRDAAKEKLMTLQPLPES